MVNPAKVQGKHHGSKFNPEAYWLYCGDSTFLPSAEID
jgi:hypothetical protein